MIRALKSHDFVPLVELAKPFIENDRLPFDSGRARKTFTRLISDRRCLALGEFDAKGVLIGAIALNTSNNTYAGKQHASLVFWFGRVALFDIAMLWAMDRPAVRMVAVLFDRDVRPAIYKMLSRKGFEKSGDTYIHWRA